MSHSKYDYKLLSALQALLHYRHVTKAGESVGLSQSAMSRELQRLREIYQDELLLRGQGGQMQLTPFAQTLLKPTQQVLQEIDALFQMKEQFDPSELDAEVTIGTSDYVDQVFLPSFVAAVRQAAPKLKLVVENVNDVTDERDFLDRNVMLAVGHFPHAPKHFLQAPLFQDSFVCAAHKDHPIFKEKPKSIEAYLAVPVIRTNYKNNPKMNLLSRWLKMNDLTVNIPLTVTRLTTAMRIASASDMVITSMRMLLENLGPAYGLRTFELPFNAGEDHLVISLCWMQVYDRNPLQRWLRALAIEVGQKLSPPTA